MGLNWKLLIVVVIIIAILLWALVKNKKCKQEGNKLGMPFRCKFFDSEPITLIAEDHYYGKRDGKCYEFLDYGSNMKIRRVSMENCAEKESTKKSDVIEDVEYIYND